MLPPRPVLLAGLLWLGAVVWGFHLALAYQAAPGAEPLSVERWPSDAPIPLDGTVPTLVLSLHPRCPCSRSTMTELEQLVAHCRDRMRLYVLVYADPALGPDWERSDLWERASYIPGARVLADPLGASARLFGARTSGQVSLFAPDGRLLFEGGITAARGHEGDNPGAEAVADFVLRGDAPLSHTPVFGCALAAPADEEARP